MAEKKLPFYKGKPLVRCGNTLYYGHPAEAYVAMLQILSTKSGINGQSQADKVLIQLLATDESLSPKDRVLKKAEKNSLYEAINIATIWLERSLVAVE